MSDMAGGRIMRAARLFVLLTGGILAGMVPLGILPSLTQMADHFSAQGNGTLIAQNVITIVAPTMALGAPLIGWLTEVFGKRPVFLMSALFFGLAGAAGAVAPDLWTLLISRIVLGLAAAGVTTMTIAYIGDYYPGEQRDKLIGWYAMIGSGGSFFTLLAAGRLADIGGWRAPFLLYLVGLLIMALAIPTLADAKDKKATTGTRAEDGSIRDAFGIYALILVLSVVMYTVTIQGPFMLKAAGIVKPSLQSNILMMTTVGAVLGSYIFAFVRPKMGFLGVLALVWAAFGLSIVGFALTADVVALGFLSGLSGFAAGLMQPLTQSAVLNVVPQQAAARAIGPAVGFHFLGQFLHPFAFLPLHTALGGQAAFLWTGAAALVASGATILWQLRAATRRAALS
jgi:predicted MFS family arabinose efflux permease